MSHKYDAIIIGTGQAAPALANRLSGTGMSVAIVERHLFGGMRVDMKRVKARKDAISEKSRTGVEQWLRGMPRCDVYTGHARFRAAHEVAVGDQILGADRIFINVGGRASVPAMPGLDAVPFLNNSSMMALETVPPHLLIVGGSYVGLEFGQMFRRFG